MFQVPVSRSMGMVDFVTGKYNQRHVYIQPSAGDVDYEILVWGWIVPPTG